MVAVGLAPFLAESRKNTSSIHVCSQSPNAVGLAPWAVHVCGGDQQLTETVHVQRTFFSPDQVVHQSTEDLHRVQVLHSQMSELVSYVQTFGQPLAAVPILQNQVTDVGTAVRKLRAKAFLGPVRSHLSTRLLAVCPLIC